MSVRMCDARVIMNVCVCGLQCVCVCVWCACVCVAGVYVCVCVCVCVRASVRGPPISRRARRIGFLPALCRSP